MSPSSECQWRTELDFLLCSQMNCSESDRRYKFTSQEKEKLSCNKNKKEKKTSNQHPKITRSISAHKIKPRSCVKWGGSKRTWHRVLFTGGKSAVSLLPPSASPALELSPLIWLVQPPKKGPKLS